MNTQFNSLYTEATKTALAKLANITDETLAFNTSQPKFFTAAELWNIQRQKRAVMHRRHMAQ